MWFRLHGCRRLLELDVPMGRRPVVARPRANGPIGPRAGGSRAQVFFRLRSFLYFYDLLGSNLQGALIYIAKYVKVLVLAAGM